MKHEEHICRFNDGDQSCDCYDAGVESERKRISDEITKTIGASELGILKNKTTSEVLKDLHSIINK